MPTNTVTFIFLKKSDSELLRGGHVRAQQLLRRGEPGRGRQEEEGGEGGRGRGGKGKGKFVFV